MEKLNKKVDHDNLGYIVKNSDEEFAFDKLDDPMVFLNDIKTDKISLEEAIYNKIMKNNLRRYEKEIKVLNQKKFGKY